MLINFKWFNINVNLVNSFFGERLCRFLLGIKCWCLVGYWLFVNKV